MAGYFQSLAERSFTQAPRLRVAAALPYARGPEAPLEETAPAPDVANVERHPFSLPPRTSNPDLPLHPNAAPASSRPERDPAVVVAPPVITARPSLPSPATARPGPVARDAADERTPPRTQIAPAATESIASARREPAPPVSNDARFDPRVAPAASVRPARSEPHRDLPPTFKTGAAGSRGAAASARDRGDPPDVHIHIGRIELTAVTAPAPPRREPARARKPMSLDEYLQRRSGKIR